MLTVIPCPARSFDKDFVQPTRAERTTFEMPRLGIGWITQDEPTAKIRPHPCTFISGMIKAESSMIRTSIISS